MKTLSPRALQLRRLAIQEREFKLEWLENPKQLEFLNALFQVLADNE